MADQELYTDELRDRARAMIAKYPVGKERSALLPLLHLVQSVEGRVTTQGVAFCAEMLGLTKANVGAVATFYTMYKRRPTGDWLVSVCTNTMCGMMGGDKTFAALSEYLGVGNDETTADGKITLEHAECLAACDYAPAMTVNYEYFNEVDEDKAIDIVKRLQDGARPRPDRGAPLCTLREIEFQLAGHADERGEGVAGNAAGDATLAGARLAAEYDVAVPGFDPNTPIPSKQSDGNK
jgi:NADH-quinone oxidoreductase subunit E